jgi:hypothetical protein
MIVTAEAPVLVCGGQMAVPREGCSRPDSRGLTLLESQGHWMRPGDSTQACVTVDPPVGGGFRIVMGANARRGLLIAEPARITQSDCRRDLPSESVCRPDRLPSDFENGLPAL